MYIDIEYRCTEEVRKSRKGYRTMYVITMKVTRQYAQREYTFGTKKEAQTFLESLNDYEIDSIESIEKYNKKSFRAAWHDFFNY